MRCVRQVYVLHSVTKSNAGLFDKSLFATPFNPTLTELFRGWELRGQIQRMTCALCLAGSHGVTINLIPAMFKVVVSA